MSRLAVGEAYGAKVSWAAELPLDAEFSPIRQRRADVGLGWIDPAAEAFPAPLEVMNRGQFEPVVWLRATDPAAPAA